MTDIEDVGTDYSLLRRQVNDIIAQCEKAITDNQNFSYYKNLENYSEELKLYVKKNVKDDKLLKMARDIPILNIKKYHIKTWFHYLIFPWYLTLLYHELSFNKEIIHEIGVIKNCYQKINDYIDSTPHCT